MHGGSSTFRRNVFVNLDASLHSVHLLRAPIESILIENTVLSVPNIHNSQKVPSGHSHRSLGMKISPGCRVNRL